jgi:hypothetical protein
VILGQPLVAHGQLDGEHTGREMERLEASIAQVQSDSAAGGLQSR